MEQKSVEGTIGEDTKEAAVRLLEHLLEKVKAGELRVSSIEQERNHDKREHPTDPLKWQFRYTGRSTVKLWLVGEGTDWG
jgi:hypothetical protein